MGAGRGGLSQALGDGEFAGLGFDARLELCDLGGGLLELLLEHLDLVAHAAGDGEFALERLDLGLGIQQLPAHFLDLRADLGSFERLEVLAGDHDAAMEHPVPNHLGDLVGAEFGETLVMIQGAQMSAFLVVEEERELAMGGPGIRVGLECVLEMRDGSIEIVEFVGGDAIDVMGLGFLIRPGVPFQVVTPRPSGNQHCR